MKCLKCGVERDENNKNNPSCRIHTYNNGSCTRCLEIGNCYHEWVYFYSFWSLFDTIRKYIKKKFEINNNNHEDEYVIL
jgi:hypothetical protein|tara:strand:- start:1886 stop:2122 length:237 start_codon:yes stop_codon:yes gene_type:complete